LTKYCSYFWLYCTDNAAIKALRALDFICLGYGEEEDKVLDPVLGKESREAQSAVHSRIIGDLHDKLFDCIFDMFTGLEDDRSSYKIVFYNLAHRPAKK